MSIHLGCKIYSLIAKFPYISITLLFNDFNLQLLSSAQQTNLMVSVMFALIIGTSFKKIKIFSLIQSDYSFIHLTSYQKRTSILAILKWYKQSLPIFFYIYRGLFCWVGLPIVTSGGLADLLLWRTISPVMNSHSSESVCTHDKGDVTKASLNVRNEESKVSTGFTPGGGEMLRGLGDNL